VRWVDGYRQVNELAEQLPNTRLTYVADIYDLFVEAPCPEAAADWLVRGQHDRVLANGKTLRRHLMEAAVLTCRNEDKRGVGVVKAHKPRQQRRLASCKVRIAKSLSAPGLRDIRPSLGLMMVPSHRPSPSGRGSCGARRACARP
jgi:hypothetical protein